MKSLSHYLKRFVTLNRASNKGCKAPHKPVLLLAILHLIQTKQIRENKIYITAELVAAFKDGWQQLVTGTGFTPNFSLPFYHLKSEGFWHLHSFPGREIPLTRSHSIGSFGSLKDTVWFASFDEALFRLLVDEQSSWLLQETLLRTYFAQALPVGIALQSSLAARIEAQMLQEPATVYRQQVAAADEEELFVRGSLFRKLVPAVYHHTCCISGMQVIASGSSQLIDACHIVPFSISYNDTIRNGLSLCPNLHRAFDRGLIAVTDNYEVLVSSAFTEQASSYAIRPYAGKGILLPAAQDHYPDPASLAWHRTHIFKP